MAEKGHGLCDEMLVLEILSRLPTKHLFRFKCVSKTWSSLIQSKSLPSNMLGVFYQEVANRNIEPHIFHSSCSDNDDTHIDTTLGFLPLRYYPEIVDSCNGLLLCRPLLKECCLRKTLEVYYVCNPATKRWDSLPSIPYNKPDLARLAFDPHVSPHYKVLWVKHCGTHTEFHIFSSENRRDKWQKIVSLQPIIELDANGRCGGVFSNGALYITSSGHNRYHIVRFNLLRGTHKMIMLPPGYASRPIIGILKGRICCAELVASRLRIWGLVEQDHNDATSSWVLKHDITVAQFEDERAVMAFHPFSDFVFVQTQRGFWSCNISGGSRPTVVNVDSEEIQIKAGMALPYTPCYVDKLKGKRNLKTKIDYCLIDNKIKIQCFLSFVSLIFWALCIIVFHFSIFVFYLLLIQFTRTL